jgi:hypothetical protein
VITGFVSNLFYNHGSVYPSVCLSFCLFNMAANQIRVFMIFGLTVCLSIWSFFVSVFLSQKTSFLSVCRSEVEKSMQSDCLSNGREFLDARLTLFVCLSVCLESFVSV